MPTSAVAKLSNGAPPSATILVSGVWVWLKASRPQEKPPSGQRSRKNSSPTHKSACHTGAKRSRATEAVAAASGAK